MYIFKLSSSLWKCVFYNGTNNKNIYPTPVIGGVGLIQKLENPINHQLKKKIAPILVVGKTFGHLEQSVFC